VELVEGPVDGCLRAALSSRAKVTGDLLRAQQAPTFIGQQFHYSHPRCPEPKSGAGDPAIGELQPGFGVGFGHDFSEKARRYGSWEPISSTIRLPEEIRSLSFGGLQQRLPRTPVSVRGCQGAVIVAVIAVGVVKRPIDEIVHMLAVRNLFMAAIGAVDVIRGVRSAYWRAPVRIRAAHGDDVLVNVVAVRVMKVPVVQVVDVSVVLNCGVAATGSVLMLVRWVRLVIFHSETVPPASASVN